MNLSRLGKVIFYFSFILYLYFETWSVNINIVHEIGNNIGKYFQGRKKKYVYSKKYVFLYIFRIFFFFFWCISIFFTFSLVHISTILIILYITDGTCKN